MQISLNSARSVGLTISLMDNSCTFDAYSNGVLSAINLISTTNFENSIVGKSYLFYGNINSSNGEKIFLSMKIHQFNSGPEGSVCQITKDECKTTIYPNN